VPFLAVLARLGAHSGSVTNSKTDSLKRIFARWHKACLDHHWPTKNSYRCGAAPRVRCTAQSRLNTKTDWSN